MSMTTVREKAYTNAETGKTGETSENNEDKKNGIRMRI